MFKPIFTISPSLVKVLMELERVRQEISVLPITPTVLANLRESSRLESTHFSTKIEGNRLSEEQVVDVLKHHKRFVQRERDEAEVLGYYAALHEVERLVLQGVPLCEQEIKRIHGFVMGKGEKKISPTEYRDGQNVIRVGRSGAIVYLPPEAQDVSRYMQELVAWLGDTEHDKMPAPLRAGIAHYQFATIHPYYDGNGRTARLLTTWVLHQSGYGLKGVYSLEEYYAENLSAYYEALTVGSSHNYYFGRAEADITGWVTFFCEGMLESFKKIKAQAQRALESGADDSSYVQLTVPQRKILTLFARQDFLTVADVSRVCKIHERSARNWVSQWVKEGFLVVGNTAKKNRNYVLSSHMREVLK